MSSQEEMLEAGAAVRSGVKIEMSAKGMAQLKVSVYEGTAEEEMQRVKNLAIRTYEVALRELAAVTTVAFS